MAQRIAEDATRAAHVSAMDASIEVSVKRVTSPMGEWNVHVRMFASPSTSIRSCSRTSLLRVLGQEQPWCGGQRFWCRSGFWGSGEGGRRVVPQVHPSREGARVLSSVFSPYLSMESTRLPRFARPDNTGPRVYDSAGVWLVQSWESKGGVLCSRYPNHHPSHATHSPGSPGTLIAWYRRSIGTTQLILFLHSRVWAH